MPSLFPLVGRVRELDELREHVREAAAGRGRLVLLGGEAGGGKTALLESLLRETGEMPYATGRCPGPGETAPFGPWQEVVRRTQRELGRDPQPLPPPFGQAPGSWSPREVAGALVGWLGGEGRPLLVALEDIHWADPGTLELLRHLPDQVADGPVLLMATYRSDELNRHHPLWSLLPDLQRAGAHRVLLERLSPADVVEMISAALPSRAEVAGLARQLHQRTDGHPLFLKELVAGLVRTGGELEAELPETVQQAIDRKLDGLRPGAREVLQAAAIIGELFDYDLLQRVVELPEEELIGVLEEAVVHRVLRPRGASGELFQFDHALVREVLVGQLLGPRRRRWHARVAAALEAVPNPDVEALALHLSRAGDPRAADYLRAAADRALKLGALAQAAQMCEEALAFLPETDPRRGELLLKLGFCLKHEDRERAKASFQEALRTAEAAGDLPAAVWSRHMLAVYGSGDEAELSTVVSAQEGLLADPRYLRLEEEIFGQVSSIPRAAVRLVIWYSLRGREEEAEALLRSLEERAHPGIAHEILDAALFVQRATRRRRSTGELVYRAMESALAARDYRAAVRFLMNQVNSGLISGQPKEVVDEAARRLAALEAEAWERTGYPYHPGGFSVLGFYQFVRGDWTAAARNLVEHNRRHPANTGPERFFAEMLLLESGRLEELRSFLSTHEPFQPDDLPPVTSVEEGYHALHALLHLAGGDLAAARAWLEGASHWQERLGHRASRPMVELTWACYHRAAGEPDAAREAAERALDIALRQNSAVWIVQARRFLAEQLAGEGRRDEAAGHLQEARAITERAGFPYYGALVRLSAAKAFPELPESLAGLEEARQTFAQLGAAPALAEAEELLPRLRERSSKPETTSGAALPGGLTEREAEVVRLVAQGLTDKEIAAQLYISPRTVDGHLRNIFNKVGVSNRAALASFAAQTGLVRAGE
ncbi:MAG: helix-turn-helix transcriptional regulator [Bacillota bacterium]